MFNCCKIMGMVLTALVLMGTCSVWAGTMDWTGAAGTDWANPANWAQSLPPQSGDSVRIMSGTPVAKDWRFTTGGSMLVDGSGTVWTGSNYLTMDPGTSLTVSNLAAVHVNMESYIKGQVLVDNALFDGGDCTIREGSVVVRNGGRVSGRMYLILTCDLTASGAGTLVASGDNLHVEGHATISDGACLWGNATALGISKAGTMATLDLSGPGTFLRSSDGLHIDNAVLTVRDGAAVRAGYVWLREGGRLVLESGTLQVGDGLDCEGTLEIDCGPQQSWNIQGNYKGYANGTLQFDLHEGMQDEDLLAGPQLNVAGNLFLAGAMKIVLADDMVLEAGDQFCLMQCTGDMTGRFQHLDLPKLPDSLAWDTSMLYTDGMICVRNSVVPEPLTLAVAPLVGLALLRSVRRRLHGATARPGR